MLRKRFWRIALVCLWLGLAALACANPLSGAAPQAAEESTEVEEEAEEEAEELPTPTSEPTPTPEPQLELPQVHRSEGPGFSMSLPEEWVVMDLMFVTFAAPNMEALEEANTEEMFTTPVVMAMIGPPDEMDMEADSVDDLTEQMLEEDFDPGPDMTVSEPVSLTVGGLDAVSIDISGTDPDTGQEIAARMITVLGAQHAGVFIGISPLDDWEDFSPTFDAIIASVEFFEPNPDAMMEGFEEGFEEGTEEGMGGTAEEATYTDKIEPGIPISSILEDGEVHDWTFQAAAGDTITITATPGDDELDMVLVLVSPSGNVLVEMDDGWSGEPEVITFQVTEAGTYTAQARGFALFGGPYTIQLEQTGGVQLGEGEIRQWAISATASSEYSDDSWSAAQAVGPPDTYPQCGDIETAWASAYSDDISTLTLTYTTPVIPTRLEIYQTYHPGAISKIELIDTSGGSRIIYTGAPKLMDVCPYIMVLSITGVTEPINKVIIHIDQSTTNEWNEIDAVELIGTP